MSGNRIGGLKSKVTLKRIYGDDFYNKIGHLGGIKGKTGGFGSKFKGRDGLTGQERASLAGAVGGKISKRRKREV